MNSPLRGVTILDLSHALAGPYCSTMLADYGATVIKIEPHAGDIARAWGIPLPGGETSYFVSLHRNKKSIVLDLKSARGKELFLELVEKADVVIENYRVGTLAKLGIQYEIACRRNPGIIYASISGFGQDGPYRDRAALDLILQAESGMISVTGEQGGAGVRCGVSIADLTSGMHAIIGILLALRVKENTGHGQSIDISMMEGQLSLLGNLVGSFLSDGKLPSPMGTSYSSLAPYQTFRTATKDIAIAVGSQKLWKIFCSCIGHPELTDSPDFCDNAARSRNIGQLSRTLQEIFLQKSFDEWESVMLKWGVPLGAINNLSDLIEHPQIKAREALVELQHPTAGTVKMVGVPMRLSRTPGSVRTPSPLLGEHTEDILREMLGLSAHDISTLR